MLKLRKYDRFEEFSSKRETPFYRRQLRNSKVHILEENKKASDRLDNLRYL